MTVPKRLGSRDGLSIAGDLNEATRAPILRRRGPATGILSGAPSTRFLNYVYLRLGRVLLLTMTCFTKWPTPASKMEACTLHPAPCTLHRVSIVSQGIRGCSSTGIFTLASNVKATSSRLSVDAAGEMTIDEIVDVNGTVTASCLSGSGSGAKEVD